MGGALPQAVDHLYLMNDEVEDPDLMAIDLQMSRWGYTGSMTYEINRHSGLILNQQAYPTDYGIKELVEELPYMRKEEG